LGDSGDQRVELAGFDAERCLAVGAGHYGGFGACFGDVHGDGGPGRPGSVEDVDVAGEFGVAGLPGGAVGKMDVVVVDEGSGHGDEGDVAGKAAVVEPVDTDRGYAIYKASGVDGDDDEVRAGMEHCGNFAIERRVAALVVADALLVDPDVRAVVGRADVEEGAGAGFGLGVEVPLVPENAFVVEELGTCVFQSPGTLRVGAVAKSYSSLCLPTMLGWVFMA
jgi:hypothetical protein